MITMLLLKTNNKTAEGIPSIFILCTDMDAVATKMATIPTTSE
jgi:hypothetical protein